MKLFRSISIVSFVFFYLLLFTGPVMADNILNVSSPVAQGSGLGEFSLTSLDYWTGYLPDASSLLVSPLHWGKTEWLEASAVTGITILLYQNDQAIKNWVQENRNATTDTIALSARAFGDGRYTLAPLTLFYVYGCWKDDLKARRAASLSIESYVMTGILTQAIKFSGHRHRPNTGDPYDSWDGPNLSLSDFSFPSGHSSSAFAVATVIATEYGENRLVPVIAYGIAGLTAWSRINDNYHWASDVFFGSALGYFTAKEILKRHSGDEATGLAVFPVISEGNMGIRVGYRM